MCQKGKTVQSIVRETKKRGGTFPKIDRNITVTFQKSCITGLSNDERGDPGNRKKDYRSLCCANDNILQTQICIEAQDSAPPIIYYCVFKQDMCASLRKRSYAEMNMAHRRCDWDGYRSRLNSGAVMVDDSDAIEAGASKWKESVAGVGGC